MSEFANPEPEELEPIEEAIDIAEVTEAEDGYTLEAKKAFNHLKYVCRYYDQMVQLGSLSPDDPHVLAARAEIDTAMESLKGKVNEKRFDRFMQQLRNYRELNTNTSDQYTGDIDFEVKGEKLYQRKDEE